MKNIGFNFTTNDFRYCVVEKKNNNIALLEKDKIVYPNALNIVERSGWLETQICLILDKHTPEIVGYKLPLVRNSWLQITFSPQNNKIYPKFIVPTGYIKFMLQ